MKEKGSNLLQAFKYVEENNSYKKIEKEVRD